MDRFVKLLEEVDYDGRVDIYICQDMTDFNMIDNGAKYSQIEGNLKRRFLNYVGNETIRKYRYRDLVMTIDQENKKIVNLENKVDTITLNEVFFDILNIESCKEDSFPVLDRYHEIVNVKVDTYSDIKGKTFMKIIHEDEKNKYITLNYNNKNSKFVTQIIQSLVKSLDV